MIYRRRAEVLAGSVPEPAWLLGGLRCVGGPVLPGEKDAGLVGLSSSAADPGYAGPGVAPWQSDVPGVHPRAGAGRHPWAAKEWFL